MNLPKIQDRLASWGLSEIKAIHEVMEGTVNQVLQLHLADKVLFLRLYKTKDKEVIEREHHLIQHVAAHVPVSTPLRNQKGNSVGEYEGRFFALYPQAHGIQIKKTDLTIAQASSAGETLAKIHKATESLPDTGYRKYSLKWDPSEWLGKLDHLQNLMLQKKEEQSWSLTDHWAFKRLQQQREWLKSCQSVHAYNPQFPSQTVHGDFHYGNLFFKGSEVSNVIDWDQAAYMPRAFEVARAISYMFHLRPEPTHAFLKSYLGVNPLTPAELNDGAHAWACQHDHYIWAFEEMYIQGNSRAAMFVPHLDFEPFKLAWDQVVRL